MGLSVFSILAHAEEIGGLYDEFQTLATDTKALVTDTNAAKVLAANPALDADVAAVSQLWRTAENDVSAIEHDKAFISKLKALDAESVDVNHIFQALGRIVKDPAVIAFASTEEAQALPALTDLEETYTSLAKTLSDLFGISLPALP